MIRKQLFLREDQERWLKRQAQATGKSEADLMRQALDAFAERHYDQDWEGFLASLRCLPADGGVRDWTRASLHERSPKKS